jgi:hypothetical protein
MTIDKSFEIYELLRKHIKDDTDAKTIAYNIEAIVDQKINDKKDILATKQDISDAKFDLLKWIIILILGQTGVLFALLKLAVNK